MLLGGGGIARPPGVLAPDDPIQDNVADVRTGSATATTSAPSRASRSTHALAASRYRRDREGLAPVDSRSAVIDVDTAVIDALSISQGARFYSYSWSNPPPILPGDIARHSANMHMIPGDETVRASLLEARPGNLVHLKGWLIEAKAADGWHWRSSLSRGDTGGGACEVVLVEALSLE